MGLRHCAKLTVVLAALILAISASFSRAQTTETSTTKDGETKESPVVFVPPAIGVPAGRVGAGTRDTEIEADGKLKLLIPEGGGLTTLERPPLVWVLAEGFDGVMQADIGLVSGEAVLQNQRGRFPPGYYGLDLNRSDYQLETGGIYRWRVALIDRSSGRIISEAAGFVERVAPSRGDLSAAAAGLWFDALEPYVSIGLSGRARIVDPERYNQLATSAGVSQ